MNRLVERRLQGLSAKEPPRTTRPSPETVTARVTQASMHDIECWLDRVLHAASLDAVFAR